MFAVSALLRPMYFLFMAAALDQAWCVTYLDLNLSLFSAEALQLLVVPHFCLSATVVSHSSRFALLSG